MWIQGGKKMQDKLLQTPDGVRDTYDVECKKKRKIIEKLHHTLELYSYHDIETPTFEYFDIAMDMIGVIIGSWITNKFISKQATCKL